MGVFGGQGRQDVVVIHPIPFVLVGREESCLPMRVSGRASWRLGGWKGVRKEEMGVENILAEGRD